jgi:uncharacterized alpha-E superfamily protein
VISHALFARSLRPKDEGGFRTLVNEVFGAQGPGGLKPAIGHVRGLVRGLRDRVSADAWRILQGLERRLEDFNLEIEEDQIGAVVELLNRLTVELLAFSGVVAESMTRGQAWRFLDMGNRVERAIAVARLVRNTLVEVAPSEPAVLDAVLEIADSSLTYRRRYLTQLEVPAVVDLLVADESNPRAVVFQVVRLEKHLTELPREPNHPQANPDQQAVLKLCSQLRLADLRSLCAPSRRGTRPGLAALMTTVIESMATVSESVSQIYFSHATTARSVQGRGEERPR